MSAPTVAEAIALFDKSATRTTPNAQTAAWTVLRAEIDRLRDYEKCAAILAVERAEFGIRARKAEEALLIREAEMHDEHFMLINAAKLALTVLPETQECCGQGQWAGDPNEPPQCCCQYLTPYADLKAALERFDTAATPAIDAALEKERAE